MKIILQKNCVQIFLGVLKNSKAKQMNKTNIHFYRYKFRYILELLLWTVVFYWVALDWRVVAEDTSFVG